MFGRRNSKQSGGVVIGGKHVGYTIQCVHCGGHFISRPGSGKKRGYCLACDGITCGKPPCMAHIPYEAKLDYNDAVHLQNVMTIKKLESRYPEIKLFH